MANGIADASSVVELTADVVAAFVSNNSVPVGEVPGLIQSVHAAFAKLAGGAATAEIAAPVVAKEPAVSIRKSLTADYLICLEDGKKLKSMKRHLSGLGMTPDQYRQKWNLPADYPMVAPNYAAQRSEMAKKIGLGQMRGAAGSPKAK